MSCDLGRGYISCHVIWEGGTYQHIMSCDLGRGVTPMGGMWQEIHLPDGSV